MKRMRYVLLIFVGLAAVGRSIAGQEDHDLASKNVDAAHQKITTNVAGMEIIAVIDHSRLAAKAGVRMPPSIVTIASDASINTPLVKNNPQIGLDLPIKILAYAEPGESKASIAFATDEFIAARHGIDDRDQLAGYQKSLENALNDCSNRSPVIVENVEENFGIVEMKSEYPFAETIDRIKKAVLSQGDTVWFGEIDYQKDASELNEQISPATLLLFGGPAPGGKAMAEHPKLGLDAFCQKLLVYEDDDGSIKVIYNDIVVFAELHYGNSNQPQKVINSRLTRTFEAAISK